MEELFPELGEEAGVAITDDILGEAVVSGDMVEEENGNVFGIVRGGTRNEMSTFGQAANNDVDAIMPAVGLGKTAHEVHGNGLPSVFYARGNKCAFAELGVEFLVAEDGENLAEMIKVGLQGGAKNKDVVKVDHDTDFEEVAEDVIHGGLECGGGVGETERHYEKLVVPEAGAEGGFVGVLLADADLVEATAEVDIGEVFGSTEGIKKFGYPGKRILVLDRDPVQGVLVRAHAEFGGAVLFLTKRQLEGGDLRVGGGVFVGFVRWKQVLGTVAVNDKAMVGGVGVLTDHVKKLVRRDEGRGGGREKVGDVKGWIEREMVAERARNFTVDAPKETATNLSWNWAVPAQAEEIMALRRRCLRPNLTSRVCRSCSSTRSEKVMEGLGRRVVEHVAVGCSADGIEDVVGRRAGGVACDAWGVSGVKVVAGRRIVDARTWLQGAGGQCSSGGGPRGRGGGGGSGCGRAGSGGAGSLVGGAAGLGAIGLLMPQLAATEGTAVGLEEGTFGGAEVRKAIMVEKAGKEIGERELGLMGTGCGEVVEAYPLDAGDEDVVRNESRRDVEAEVAKLIDAVIDGLLRTEGGDEKVGPLKEGDAGKAVGSTVWLRLTTIERRCLGGVRLRWGANERGACCGDRRHFEFERGKGGRPRGGGRRTSRYRWRGRSGECPLGCEEGRETGREVTGVEEGVVEDGGGVVLEDEAWPAWLAERLWPDWPEEGGWLFWPEEDGWPVWPAGVDWMDWPVEEGGDDVVATVVAGVWFSREVTRSDLEVMEASILRSEAESA
ncbi:hypothetical protein CBR_g54798 [Chara braunii]|uniref:Uncharacterized protein n=1 Tax=Chara braunii TaxID=69332 RepID=A0A388JPI9_CHABU|nr:hypothetical protein CBR_g54798 [Chara braunii]|eukprot:GBG59693.1 hypothetical protein CBR_g54798 [Chara braunii]